MKVFKAVGRFYANQLITVFVSVFLLLPLFNLTQSLPKIFSLITFLIYFMTMYSSAWRIGLRDARKIPGYFPDYKTPMYISIFTAIIPIILLVVRLCFPNILYVDLPFMVGTTDFILKGCKIEGTMDFIYRIWYFPFAAFVPTGNIIAYVLEIFVLPIIIFAGYSVGLRKFSIMEFLYAKAVFSSPPDKGKAKGKRKSREDALRR